MEQPAPQPIITNGASSSQTNGHSSNDASKQQNAEQAPQPNGVHTISEDEIALYDRQIRLWGVQAQEKLRNANILLITMRALSNEIAKNLVLAGIGSLTVQDDQPVKPEDLGAQFFLRESDVGKNRAEAAAPEIRKLNPRVTVNVDTRSVANPDVDSYQRYSMVIATDLDLLTFTTINAACRLAGIPFYAAGTHGFYGFIFADLGQEHFYAIEREKSNQPTRIGKETETRNIISTSTKRQDGKVIELVTKREIYTPMLLANTSPLLNDAISNRRRKLQVPPLLACLRALWEFQTLSSNYPGHSRADLELFTTLATQKHKELQLPQETLKSEFLRSFIQNIGCEMNAVVTFLGGQLAQDVINVLGQREQPIQNFLLFDGEESKGLVYALHPIFPDLDIPSVAAAAAPATVPAALPT